MDIQCFSEGTTYQLTDNKRIADNLNELSDLVSYKDDKFKFNISGLAILNDFPIVIFPKNYDNSEDEDQIKSEAIILFRALMRYRNECKNDPREQELLYGGEHNHNGRITSAILLIEDFNKNGLLNRKATIESTYKKGFINWSSTINKITPYINHSRPIYSTQIMNSNFNDSNNILKLIHKYVIGNSFKIWGWILGYSNIEHSQISLNFSEEEAISILKIELTKTFIKREIEVINNLISYLDSSIGKNNRFSYEFFATKQFHFVWEFICSYIFENQYVILKDIIPKPVWVSSIFNAQISQRPDILLVEKDMLFIIDAKYYNYNNNLPGWQDVVKQIYYKHSIEEEIKSEFGKRYLSKVNKIRNVFIFPHNKSEIKYLGYVHVPEVDRFGKVYAYAINIKEAMDIYATRKKTSFRNTFIYQFENDLLLEEASENKPS